MHAHHHRRRRPRSSRMRMPDLFDQGLAAEMSYYEQPNGARVFAAGAFTLAGLADSHVGAKILDNLITDLATR